MAAGEFSSQSHTYLGIILSATREHWKEEVMSSCHLQQGSDRAEQSTHRTKYG